MKLCANCERVIIGSKALIKMSRFCGVSCRQKWASKQYRESNPKVDDLNTCNVGALHEILVCADLLKQGYDVFRSVSSSSSCDIIAMKNKVIHRVEVTTGRYDNYGVVIHAKKDFNKFDILAVVTRTDRIIRYTPHLI